MTYTDTISTRKEHTMHTPTLTPLQAAQQRQYATQALLNHGHHITATRYRGRTITAQFESTDIRELAHKISTNLSDRTPRETDWWTIGNR